ncbi:phage major capsid protein [Halalkalibacterium ligniniphilum]|uniref:phage major capsid protein n=1 Tax=Halalkalibacterium ligniniphilum TaxID=1134413 RepID=UPI000345D9E4|nr:phage major capsid protein [Halalkalibacterium ligniniphilum]
MNRIKEILKRKAEINDMLKDEKRSAELNYKELEKEVRELNEELEELQTRERLLNETKNINSGNGETRTVETFNAEGKKEEKRKDELGTGSLEYREAFMDFVLRGKKSDVLETRAAGTTMTTDVGTVIPQTIINRIIEKMKSYGMIYSRITQTNIKGGVSIPTSDVKPVATWQDEGTVSPKQKKATGEITFSYHKLQCRVAVTLEADTVSLDIFESSLIDNIYEAMIVALEQAIISGTGVKQPLGIVNDTRVTNSVTLLEGDLTSYSKWAETSSKLPLSAEGKVVLIMTHSDFEKYIVGMVDANGQPVARVTDGLDGKKNRRFLGYEVIVVEEYLPTFTGAADNATFGIFVNLKEYMLNSNLAFRYKKYFDEETDEFIHKTTLIADGKLADAQHVMLLNKAPAV